MPVLKLFSLFFNIVNIWNWFLIYFFFNKYFIFSQHFGLYSYIFIFSYSVSLTLDTNLYFNFINIFLIKSKNWALFKFALILIITKGRLGFGLYFLIICLILFLSFSDGDIIFSTDISDGLFILKSSKDVCILEGWFIISGCPNLFSDDSKVLFIISSSNVFFFLNGIIFFNELFLLLLFIVFIFATKLTMNLSISSKLFNSQFSNNLIISFFSCKQSFEFSVFKESINNW